MEDKCPSPTVNFTIDGQQEIILTIRREAEELKLKTLFEITNKSTAIKKSKSKTKKILKNTLCKINIHDIDKSKPWNGVCLNCGKIVQLNNVIIKE